MNTSNDDPDQDDDPATPAHLDVQGPTADLDDGLGLVGKARVGRGIVHGASCGTDSGLVRVLLAVLQHHSRLSSGCKR